MKLIKKVLIITVIVLISIGLLFTAYGYKMYSNALQEMSLEDKINSIKSEENYISIEDVPLNYLNAVVSIEDHRFYRHGAVDIISVGRAIFTNIRYMDFVEGGSTITQQVAKNIYFTQEKELTRKIAEVFMAIDIEKVYTKNEVLEFYINTSYFGSGYYGIKEASEGYFNKEPIELNMDEATLLAGIPNAPSAYAYDKHPDLARKRQEYVIKSMVENEYISQTEADEILENRGK